MKPMIRATPSTRIFGVMSTSTSAEMAALPALAATGKQPRQAAE
jgi:hypothetical protein